MLPSTTVINTPEKLIKSILNFVNGKYCSNMKQLSKTSCNFKKKEIRKMGQNSQNILEIFFFKKWPKDSNIGKRFSQKLLKMLVLTNPE